MIECFWGWPITTGWEVLGVVGDEHPGVSCTADDCAASVEAVAQCRLHSVSDAPRLRKRILACAVDEFSPRGVAVALMTVEQRAFIRTLAEGLGWSETDALAELCKAAEGAHPATNQARVARTGRAFEELTSKDAKRLIAWLRLQASERNVRTDESRYNENLQALGGTPLTDRERLERASARCPQMAPSGTPCAFCYGVGSAALPRPMGYGGIKEGDPYNIVQLYDGVWPCCHDCKRRGGRWLKERAAALQPVENS